MFLASGAHLCLSLLYLLTPETNVSLMWISLAFQLLAPCLNVAVRATVSKLVDPSETGAVFALLGFVQAFNFLVSPLINLLYVDSLDWHEGFVYCVQSLFSIVLMGCAAVVAVYVAKRGQWRLEKEVKVNGDDPDVGGVEGVDNEAAVVADE